MIPFRDNIPSRTFPLFTILIIAANVVAFIFELSLSPSALDRFIYHAGVVPAVVFEWPRLHLPVSALFAPFIMSLFLHGGWLHLIGNMWYLWIFGPGVEDRLGHIRFLLFYMLCGIGAGIVHTMMNPDATIPTVGASGAIAGVLGAYVVSYPFARVLTLVPIFIFIQIIEIPAIIVLGFWFLMQFISGTASLQVSTSANTGGVAWWAHVGGFIIGIILVSLLSQKARQTYEYRPRY